MPVLIIIALAWVLLAAATVCVLAALFAGSRHWERRARTAAQPAQPAPAPLSLAG